MEAKVVRKNIILKPVPKNAMPGALKVLLHHGTPGHTTSIIQADVEIGRKKYQLPWLPKGVKIIAVWVNSC